VTIEYSDISGGLSNISVSSPNHVNWLAGNLEIDPLLNSDYHLEPDSPCIDAGNPDPTFNDPDGSQNDMGAYGGPNGEW